MKKLVFYSFTIMLLVTACNSKNDVVTTLPYEPVAAETSEIEAFIDAYGLDMTMSPDSIWYHISNYGDTVNGRLTADSATAVVAFSCQMLDGTMVYQTPTGTYTSINYSNTNSVSQSIFSSAISYFVVRWSNSSNTFPVGKGATFDFIIPSMYQAQSSSYMINNVTIPPNSPLYYQVQFVDKQPS